MQEPLNPASISWNFGKNILDDMNMKIGRIRKVALRQLWKKEDRDFSRWLEEQIDVLNETLGITVTVEKREESVGPFRVDLYGEDDRGRKVIIENQLEKSDHDHLGKVLTYMTNLDASVGIWINSDPREEHVKVFEWLNEVTPEDMAFYLIKLEAIQIGHDDMAAPLFTIVSGPSETSKKLGEAKKEFAEGHMVKFRFWTAFIDHMNEHNALVRNWSPTRDNWIGISLGTSGISVNLVVTNKNVRAELFINQGDKEQNKKVFDLLAQQKESIEREFGSQLTWERMDEKVTSRIRYQLESVNISDEKDWSRIISFLKDTSERMVKAFKEPVSKLKYK